MKTLSLLILFTIKTRGFEITGGSDDPLIVAGEQLELNCEIDGHFDFCQWSFSDAWSCLTFSNAIDEELPCEDQERGTITASEGSCTVNFLLNNFDNDYFFALLLSSFLLHRKIYNFYILTIISASIGRHFTG